jgi:predicted dehydrogenase
MNTEPVEEFMATPPDITRRQFLETSTAVAALTGISSLVSSERVLGANDRVRVAICGLHGRGNDHLQNYAKIKNVEIAALCDIDESVLNQRTAEMAKAGLPKAAVFSDVRKLLDDKSIDAISIATPNHWHALMTIWACQAGKDVYVEKPCSHNLWEGQQMVKAAARYNRIVQHGTQSRSDEAVREAVQKIGEGAIGEVYMARGLCYKWRDTIGKAAVEPVPAGVDYDRWTGPAPLREFTKNRFHYNWHWQWAYGNGDLGNQGVHQLDVARWGLGLGFPSKVSAIGGHFMFQDDQETPNDLNCSFQFDLPGGGRRMITFEVRHWMTNNEAEIGTSGLGAPEPPKSANRPALGPSSGSRNAIGNIFYGSKGYMASGDEDAATYAIWLGRDHEKQPPVTRGSELAHFQNFIDCVVSRKKADLHAPIEEGHISAGLMHLANASYRVGRTIDFNPETQTVVGDDQAATLLRDGDRSYRAPFVIPEEV